MSLRALIQRPVPVTAPLVLNPLMARMAEAAGFPAGYLGGGSTGYQKVALEANLNVTEMCDGFGSNVQAKPDWSPVEKDMLSVIQLEKLLAIERATVENGKR
jgi:hypothetical protein